MAPPSGLVDSAPIYRDPRPASPTREGPNFRYKAAGTGTATHTWTPTLPSEQQYNVYAYWRATANRATNAPFTIHHSGGSTAVAVNQQINGGTWNLLGTFTMAPGQNHRIVLTDNANGEVAADAVQVTRVGAPPSTATWLPSLPRADTYQVYERTPGYGTWTSTAPFTVFHQGGATTTLQTQVTGGGSWKLLGTYDLYPGQNHRVELTDVVSTGSYVVADAVKFVPVASAKSATWTIPGSAIATTGNYKLYAKWPASASHTPEATYTVSYQGGTATVTANQQTNGGQWNLVGTFPFNAGGSGYKVTLADSPLGKAAADAIYIVSAAAPADPFTWTPALPSAGSWRVLVRWPASSGNTAAAQYTVTHAGGTTTVTVNQKQNGGVWNSLGSFSLTPGAGHKVTLAASANGATIADAVLFAGPTVQPANLLYVHADHLGSPQKMTTPSQAIAWDGVFDPFGEEVPLTGLAAMPLRFPGQYADDETGFSYNYFRDYEPRLGRYLQSDPIGLSGGINAFMYVEGRPVQETDEFGLSPSVAAEGATGGSSQNLCLKGDFCEEQMFQDQIICRRLPNKTQKQKVGRARCWASVEERYAACLAGRPIPPLVSWREYDPGVDPGVIPDPGIDPTPTPPPPPPPGWHDCVTCHMPIIFL